jgi:integrase/recombinase XerD
MEQRQLVFHRAVHSPSQADSDAQLVALWLHGRSRHTQRAYVGGVRRFCEFTRRPLRAVKLQDLQDFADSLGELAPSSQARTLSAVKSLLAFGHRVGYLAFNVGRTLKLPSAKDVLAERILSESAVRRMIEKERNRRNRVLLLLLYAGGLRVSELCGLRARDVQQRDSGGQVTVLGKGAKTRTILLPRTVWEELKSILCGVRPDDPVFRSRKGGPLSTSQALRVVKKAAARAGFREGVSPHWLRHAHASHALDRGAPIHLVQATLGHSSVATTGRYLHARPADSSAHYLGI